MSALAYYSFQVAMGLSVIFLFYQLALRNLTFFQWNRWYFVGGTVISVLMPLTAFVPFPEFGQVDHSGLLNTVSAWRDLPGEVFTAQSTATSFWHTIIAWVPIIFCLGVCIRGGKIFLEFTSLYCFFRSASLLEDGKIKIYQVNAPIAPFSLGNHIFINTALLQPEEFQQILLHERIHAIQKHTIDVIWLEFILLINWYNPFAWLLKRAARQNLEYIVDSEVLLNPKSDKKGYQYLLLKIINLPDLQITNHFNVSSLKTRIRMMNQKPSNQRKAARYILVLPLVVFLTFTFCGKSADEASLTTAHQQNNSETDSSFESFLERNPSVKNIHFAEGMFVVELTSGANETYDFTKESELTLFEQRYGQRPPPPPPVVIQPLGDNRFVIKSESGTEETYDLNNEAEAAKFKQQYGPYPPPAPVELPAN
jgi:hypothetical protein